MLEFGNVELDAKGYETINGTHVHWIIYRMYFGSKPRGWHVHHVDGCKTNNDPCNLIALPPKMHHTIHQLVPLPSKAILESYVRVYLNDQRRQDCDALTIQRRKKARQEAKEERRRAKAQRKKDKKSPKVKTPRHVFRELIAAQIDEWKAKNDRS